MAISDEQYKAFLQHANMAEASEEYAKILRNSSNPEEIGKVRTDLVSLINSELGPKTVATNTPDSELFTYTPKLKRISEARTLAEFLENPAEIIEFAREKANEKASKDFKDRSKPDQTEDDFNRFARRYLEVTPIETGIAKYDSVVRQHALYKGFADAMKEFHRSGEDKTESHINFVQSTAGYIKEDVAQRLMQGNYIDRIFDRNDEDDKKEIEDLEDDITDLANLVARSYLEASPEQALMKVNMVAQEVRKRVETMLPKSERANYAETMLKRGADYAGEVSGEDKRKGGAVYKQVMNDLFQIVR